LVKSSNPYLPLRQEWDWLNMTRWDELYTSY
jgi:hypothetical protein